MADKWVAECLPCKWGVNFDTQDEAIRAAEDHVFTTHRDLAPFERANSFIGHVQLRAQDAIGFQESSQADTGAVTSGPLTPEAGGAPAPSASSDTQAAPTDATKQPAQ